MGVRFRGVVVIAGVVVSFFVALFAGGALAWHVFGFLAVVLVVVAFSQLGPLSKVKVTRRISPGPYYARGTIDVTLEVTATRWPWMRLFIVEHLQCAGSDRDYRFLLTTIGPRIQTINYEVRDLERGLLVFDDITLTTSDFFGLFESSVKVRDQKLTLRVWPRIVSLTRAELDNYVWRGEQLHSPQTREEIAQLQGIREYVPGDRLSHVHWKTTAHTGDFKVKHFEPKIKAEFLVLLDVSRYFRPSDWELAVSIAASLVDQACRSRLALRVSALDEPLDRAPLPAGPGSLARMMDYLCMLPYVGEELTDPAGPARYGRHMLVITTAKVEAAWQGIAESVVVVGDGGVKSLIGWRESLGSTRHQARAPR
jgi:uncharacterized protein (DUF58 family)